MSTQAATAQRVAERMARDLLDMGAVHHALAEARRQGLEGHLVVHVLSYADSLALAIIDQLRQEGAVSTEVLSADKAHQQTHAMPGCLLMVLEAAVSQEVVAALLPDGCRADVINSITTAKRMGWLMLVVVAAGRVLGVLLEPGAPAKGSQMSKGAAERERQRRADRSRRLSR
jgi:hypothetical protein